MTTHLKEPGYQAFRILQFTFIVAPIVAGADKFLYLLTNWSQYLSPFLMHMFGGHDRVAMVIAGLIEILAGLGMLYRPKIFSYLISLWLLLIIVNLVMLGNYFDIALRDLGLFLAAIACGRLSSQYM